MNKIHLKFKNWTSVIQFVKTAMSSKGNIVWSDLNGSPLHIWSQYILLIKLMFTTLWQDSPIFIMINGLLMTIQIYLECARMLSMCSSLRIFLLFLARPHDFFDAQTLDAIRHRAICFNLSAHIESLGKGHSVVFHSTVSIKLCIVCYLCLWKI